MELRLIKKFEGFRVLTWHRDYLYASRGYSLFRVKGENLLNNSDTKWEGVGFFKQNLLRDLASKNRITSRLLRTGFHSLEFMEDKIIAVLDKHIAVLEPESKEFKSLFKIKRGTRPMGIAITPDGKMYWGEYFKNQSRNEVYIYGSNDGGYTWDVVYVFPGKTIRHIHNIQYDPYGEILWILTGDYKNESKILKADVNLTSMEEFYVNSLQARAVRMIFTADEIFYATDTPFQRNHIYKIYRKIGKIEPLCEIEGPSVWATRVKDKFFFSTHIEPGSSYYPAACLYASKDGERWSKILEWRKDRFPHIFGFGTFILSQKGCDFELLCATALGVGGKDGGTFIWEITDNG